MPRTSPPAREKPFRPSDLTQEKNLWQVWLQIRRLEESRFNVVSTLVVCALMTLYVAFTHEEASAVADHVRGWADFGLNFASALLGFLVAGFTIFATLTKPAIFLEMAQTTERKTRLSFLQVTFLNFLKSFAVFIFFIGLCYFIKAFAGQGGAMSVLIDHLPSYPAESKMYLAKIGIVIITTLFYYIIVLLQSFVFNVYHAIMTSLRWELEFPPELKP